MLEIAGGILIALAAIAAALFILGSGLWRTLLVGAFFIGLGLVTLLAAAIAGVGPAETLRSATAVAAVVAVAALACAGIAKARERVGGSFFRFVQQFVRDKATPVRGPEDPRHPDHFRWANRQGDYAER